MDNLSQNDWNSRRLLLTTKRKKDYEQKLEELNSQGILNSGETPRQIYLVALINLDELVKEWKLKFTDYWGRVNPLNPEQEAKNAEKEITETISKDEEEIKKEVFNLLLVRLKRERPLESENTDLHTHAEAWRNDCFSLVHTLKAKRQNEILLDQNRRKQRRKDLWWNAGTALVAASIGAFGPTYISRKDTIFYQTAISRLENEMTDMSHDNRLMLRWIIKNPKEIETEIRRLQEDLPFEISAIQDDFKKKRDEFVSSMAKRGIQGSSIEKFGLKKIDDDEANAIRERKEDVQRKIEDLDEQKEKLAAQK